MSQALYTVDWFLYGKGVADFAAADRRHLATGVDWDSALAVEVDVEPAAEVPDLLAQEVDLGLEARQGGPHQPDSKAGRDPSGD